MTKRVLVAGTLLLAVACGKSEPTPTSGAVAGSTPSPAAISPPAAGSKPPDVCRYLTEADVTSIVGVSMKRDPIITSNCDYKPEEQDFTKGAAIAYKVQDGTTQYDLWSGMAGIEKLDDLGDKAIWDAQRGQFVVVKGNQEVHGAVIGFIGDKAKQRATAVTLARKILDKMQQASGGPAR